LISNSVLGRSFKGVIAYITDDIRRVGYVETLNLGTGNPQKAVCVMAATSRKNTRCKKPVYHLMVSWHREDKRHLTRDMINRQIIELLQAVDMQKYQAVIAFHTDTKHPHAHIVVNRIHPETKKAASLSFERVRRAKVCRRLELEHGLVIAPKRERGQKEVPKIKAPTPFPVC